MIDINSMNSLVLAYLGDSVYELYVRKYLVSINIGKVNDLQKEAVSYVSASAQASFLKQMISVSFFHDDELDVIKRARNYKTTSHPKSCDILTYKYATGLESLIGYLDFINKRERIDEIMNFIFTQ